MGSSSMMFFSLAVLFLVWPSSLQFLSINAHYDISELEKLIRDLHQEKLHSGVDISSLLPQDTCEPSTIDRREGGGVSLQVVHRHGPCSNLMNSGQVAIRPSREEILRRDQARVDTIRDKIAGGHRHRRSHGHRQSSGRKSSVNLPARSGAALGSGNYIVTIGLGTPSRKLTIVFDTGSDIMWTQCKPCKTCYTQASPIFDPRKSYSYSNISCTTPTCNDFSARDMSGARYCSAKTCVYVVNYGDNSTTQGFLAKEKLTLSTNVYIKNFIFGCGVYQKGLFDGSAGLMGLGRDKYSVVSQSASTFGKYFSYCLPLQSSPSGHLTFGKGGTKARKFTYTPMIIPKKGSTYYYVHLKAIVVSGRILPIPSSAFASNGTILDSGTVISRLNPAAYKQLRAAFRAHMSAKGYRRVPGDSLFDTCYDLSKVKHVSYPKIALVFKGNAVMDVDEAGILYTDSNSTQMCLAFAANGDETGPAIIGNQQQQRIDIVYDVAGAKIGFGARGC